MNDMNELLDSIRTLQIKRDMVVDSYDSQIEALMALLDKKMQSAGKSSLAFNEAIAFYRSTPTAKVQDWNKVMKYVKDHDAFDILQRRISPAQLEARLEAGEDIEGVTIDRGVTLIVKGKKDASAE